METRAKRRAVVRRHRRVRRKVAGDAVRPRLAVYRSNRHIYAQLIDDLSGRTLAAASSLEARANGDAGDEKADEKNGEKNGEKVDDTTGKKADARAVGVLIARRAREAGVERAIFDRGGRLYHGRVRALAEGARKGGLQI
jgi:large subunit ribosomal protein L18